MRIMCRGVIIELSLLMGRSIKPKCRAVYTKIIFEGNTKVKDATFPSAYTPVQIDKPGAANMIT